MRENRHDLVASFIDPRIIPRITGERETTPNRFTMNWVEGSFAVADDYITTDFPLPKDVVGESFTPGSWNGLITSALSAFAMVQGSQETINVMRDMDWTPRLAHLFTSTAPNLLIKLLQQCHYHFT